ncbi:MAG: hypothetical protein GDA56_24715 [Hormoscilla sp. GM7CHS1pb]|nr:hypothetical protein [Hormoscilla sp. GM7CHS1pb]
MSLIVFGLLVVYIGGAWKFWKGYNRTQFNRTMSDKIRLSLLWPALLVANPSYRKNFRKALKG